MSRGCRTILFLMYLAVISFPVVIMFLLGVQYEEPLLVKMGKVTGLAGFSILVLEVALSGRIKALDRAFGLDRVMLFHRRMGIAAAILLATHPLLLSIGMQDFSLLGLETGWQVMLGKGALVGLFLAASGGILMGRGPIDHIVARFFHSKLAGGVVVLAFVHGLVTGSDMETLGVKSACWILFALFVGLVSFRQLMARYGSKVRFVVDSVKEETEKTWTLVLSPTADGIPDYAAGQFCFWRILSNRRKPEEHPFTIASSPTQKEAVTVTIKASGNFTQHIHEVQKGDQVLCEGPFGRFGANLDEAKSFLFLAAGVGITPIMSMLRFLRDTQDSRQIVLIDQNRTERNIVFREELDRMPATVKVVHVLSRPGTNWTGAKGYVTTDLLREHASDILQTADIYVCGPPQMMKSVVKILRALGIGKSRIHTERFTL